MTSLIIVFYLLLLLFYIITSIFIAYHLAKFSLVSSIKIVILALFSIVSAWLIISNMTIFFSIDWEDIFYNLTRLN